MTKLHKGMIIISMPKMLITAFTFLNNNETSRVLSEIKKNAHLNITMHTYVHF